MNTVMTTFLIHTLELSFVGLLAYLIYVVASLFKSEHNPIKVSWFSEQRKNSSGASSPAYSRVESITSAQIFTGLQLLEVKRKGINLSSPKEDWLDKGISFYLLGAANAITEHFECSGHDKDEVMRFLLTKNLKLSEEKADHYISHLYQVNGKVIDENAFGAGIKAAKTWLANKLIPEEYSLLSNIHTWGFIA